MASGRAVPSNVVHLVGPAIRIQHIDLRCTLHLLAIIAHCRPLISPLLKADGANLAFSANSDGSLRVRYAGWDETKVLRPGESLELVVRHGQVWAYRRGEPLKGPAQDPYKDWDGTAEPAAGGQNDRGAEVNKRRIDVTGEGE
jgi:hypothetical protein